MKKTIFLALGVVSVMLSGCANDQHVYYQGKCLSCMNNPLTGEPVNYDPETLPEGAMTVSGFNTVASQPSNTGGPQPVSIPGVSQREELRMTYAGDVDTAAALLKNAFGYMTREEAIAEKGSMAGGMMFHNGDYAYSAIPGSTYSMSGLIYGGSLRTRVSKAPTGTDVLFTFSVTRNYQGPSIESVMQGVHERAKAALR